MKTAFLLHIYQPHLQERDVIKNITKTSYFPLIKLIKNKKNISVSLNVPLSLLRHLEKEGYTDFLNELKLLVDSGKVELVGTGAYHPLLPKFPKEIIEEQIILNEYGLGYYFGSKTGFEGEPSIMIANIKGFFPPEMAVNNTVLDVVNSLGYEWMIADKVALPTERKSTEAVYDFENLKTKLVVRNREVSNLIAFSRSSDAIEARNAIIKHGKSLVVALDGETFGHHNKEGISYLDNLLDDLLSEGVEITNVSSLVESEFSSPCEFLVESSWGATAESLEEGNKFPLWDNPSNDAQKLLWEVIQKFVQEVYSTNAPENSILEGFENAPIWDQEILSKIEDENVHKFIQFHQAISSDQFWWAAGEYLPDGSLIFKKEFVQRYLDHIKDISNKYASDEFNTYLSKQSQTVLDALSQLENRVKNSNS